MKSQDMARVSHPGGDPRKRPLWLGLAVAGLLGLAGCGGGGGDPHAGGFQMPPPEVRVASVIERDIQEWDEFTGRFEAIESVKVMPRVSGYIEQVAFEQGAEVAKGDLLVRIDPEPFRAAVARARAELARANAQSTQALNDAKRAETLVAAKAISREEYDARTSGVSQAKAGVAAAAAALRQAELELEWTEVRAPIAGRVGMAESTTGNMVMAGNTMLTTLVSLSPIYVSFDGDEQTFLRYQSRVREGELPSPRLNRSPVRVGLANETGYPHGGELVFVDNQLNPATGSIRARAELDNSERRFTPGLFARVQLVGSGTHRATLIDDKAVGTDQGNKFVLILKPDDTLDYRPIKLGPLVDGLRVVESGLQAGETIVVNGLAKVRPGVKVVPQKVAMDAGLAPPQAPVEAAAPIEATTEAAPATEAPAPAAAEAANAG
jgi:RND family efflux transporter MFP subunit